LLKHTKELKYKKLNFYSFRVLPIIDENHEILISRDGNVSQLDPFRSSLYHTYISQTRLVRPAHILWDENSGPSHISLSPWAHRLARIV